MAAPSKWEDVFELKYLDVLNCPNNRFLSEGLGELRDMSIFCTCMTYNDSDNEEASWKSYDSNREQVIRVSYDFNKLCSILNAAINENIYIGIIEYKSRREILNPVAVEYKQNEGKEKNAEILYVNNFCLKQDAYDYEKELRFCKILTREQNKGREDFIVTIKK